MKSWKVLKSSDTVEDGLRSNSCRWDYEANVKAMEEKGLREVNTSLFRNKVCLNLPLAYTTSAIDMKDR